MGEGGGIQNLPSFSSPPDVPVPFHGPAIAAMVLGFISLMPPLGIVVGFVGVVVGATSLKHCLPRGARRGNAMAITGIVCSSVGIALSVFVVWLFVLITDT